MSSTPVFYPTGIAVSDAEINAVNLRRTDFHDEWNYAILPKRRRA
ncbi:hypothetical protein RM530_09400 [Algiphilus sp. W345]|uniref:Uncharacterized protein n=1 Tax=Banduia mediterranea TaxID=3075609 RepID=A0ABU2WI88_9GAMM|nr:hypothetical protein [Algiphilus sp. W345]MDT0497576.1 hypothetical protein [Algiphilus sp. W345]